MQCKITIRSATTKFIAMPTTLRRSAGILLHPTSLPGPFGIGDLGPESYRWVETLVAAKQTWWQILPLGPTGYGNSPYQSFSAFAGNVNLLSPELLTRDGLLPEGSLLSDLFPNDHVDFDRVASAKATMVRAAWSIFGSCSHPLHADFEIYREKEKHWLTDYALFMAIREALGGASLTDWPSDIRRRHPAALAELEKTLAGEVMLHTFGQFLFDRQWGALKTFANSKQVQIIGDAPIFVSGDSSDVWAHPEQFLLNDDGEANVVAGVPPDYFSEDGQLWGNPLYNWDAMERDGYHWWADRLQRQFTQVDLVRLDHFRGFAAAWHVHAGSTTAKHGQWVDGPREKLFLRLQGDLGELPLIAEDLGLITPDVHALREGFGFPGMRVLQFALGGPDNPYWPHNYEPNTVAYTGTHDNDTTIGWWAGLGQDDRKRVAEYVGHEVHEPHWELIRLAWASVAVVAIAPLQDLLGLGREARMNVPGMAGGNWGWRFSPDQFRSGMVERLRAWTLRYNRVPSLA